MEEETIQFNPFSNLMVKYVPAFLLQKINDKMMLREPEKVKSRHSE